MKSNIWRFCNPTKIVFGVDSLNELRNEIQNYPCHENILLICGKKAARQLGYIDKVTKILEDKNICLFDKVEPNPEIKLVDNVLKIAKDKKTELVIALGGGSVIDTAKVVALLANKDHSVQDFLYNNMQIKEKGLICFAIPTTSGTGSEVTSWASIWDHDEKRKISFEHPSLYPACSIVDPCLTLNKSEFLTAVTGLDALCHAVEAYWSKKSNPISDSFAGLSIPLIVENLTNAVKYPEDLKYRINMAKASLYAGLAISQTKTTACHAISYPLTASFGIPHGLACAMTLPHMFKFNASAIGEKAQKLAEWFGADSIESTPKKILEFLKSLNVSTRLSEMNVRVDDIDGIFNEDVLTERITNNPKNITKKDLTEIIENIL